MTPDRDSQDGAGMAHRRTRGAAARLGGLLGYHPMPGPGLLAGGAPSRPALGRETVRLLTWNVHKEAGAAWRRDFERLLDEHRPDIVHLQEARVDATLAAFSGRSEAWAWMASPNLALAPARRNSPGTGSAVGAFTAARAPLQRGAALLSDASEPLLRSRKPMLRCVLPLQDSPAPVLSLNIHALNFSLGLAGYAGQLDALLGGADAHRGPVLFSGDFNTWNRWRMDLLLRRAEAAGLRRVAFEAEGPLPRWLSIRALDHVFYSPGDAGLKPASARILASIRSSDHAPLLVDFVP